MANTEKEIKENYTQNLKAVEYVSMMANIYNEDITALRMPLVFLYDVLLSGRFTGSSLLEIGSGAVVHHIASASAFYPNIVMTDFVEDNCSELKSWLRGQSTLQQFLDILAELEGYGKDLDTGKKILENRIRKCVKQVVRCDVLNENIFMEEVKTEVSPPYDLIISSLCLESSAPDFKNFIQILKRINKLLRSGGGLILIGFFHGGKWAVKENDFHYLQISEEELRLALEESGFGNIDMKKTDEELNIEYGHSKFYCLAAEKI